MLHTNLKPYLTMETPPLSPQVRNQVHVKRTFWKHPRESAKPDYPGVVDLEESMWSLTEDEQEGEACKVCHARAWERGQRGLTVTGVLVSQR